MNRLSAPNIAKCHHYESIDEVPEDIQKYWWQRHDIFSRYDEGVWLTDAAWFGVTPEPIADAIAVQISMSAPPSKRTFIDAFAGTAMNTISIALHHSDRWDRIFAVEKDAATLACAKHNAEIYGVARKIVFILGDCFEVMRKQLKGVVADSVIFASPPWGGPGYKDQAVFKTSGMLPYGLGLLYKELVGRAKDVVMYLPRSSDLNELVNVMDGEVRVVHYCMRGASKALCVYYGFDG